MHSISTCISECKQRMKNRLNNRPISWIYRECIVVQWCNSSEVSIFIGREIFPPRFGMLSQTEECNKHLSYDYFSGECSAVDSAELLQQYTYTFVFARAQYIRAVLCCAVLYVTQALSPCVCVYVESCMPLRIYTHISGQIQCNT